MPQFQRGNYLGNQDQEQQKINNQGLALLAQNAQQYAEQAQINRQRKIDFQGELLKNDLMQVARGNLGAYANTQPGYDKLYAFNKLLGMSDKEASQFTDAAKAGMITAEGFEKLAMNYAAGGVYDFEKFMEEQQGTTSTTPPPPSNETPVDYTVPAKASGGENYSYTPPEKREGVGVGGGEINQELRNYIGFRKKYEDALKEGNDEEIKQAEGALMAAATKLGISGQNFSQDQLNDIYNRYWSGEDFGGQSGTPWEVITGANSKSWTEMYAERTGQATPEGTSELKETGNPNYRNEVQGVYVDYIGKSGGLNSDVWSGGGAFNGNGVENPEKYAPLRKIISDSIQGQANDQLGASYSNKTNDAYWSNTKIPEGKSVTVDLKKVGEDIRKSGLDWSALPQKMKEDFGLIGNRGPSNYPSEDIARNRSTATNVGYTGQFDKNADLSQPASGTRAEPETTTMYTPVSSSAEASNEYNKFSIEGTVDSALKDYEATAPTGAKNAIINQVEGNPLTARDNALANYMMNMILDDSKQKIKLTFNRKLAGEQSGASSRLLDAMEANKDAVNNGTYAGYLTSLIPAPDSETVKGVLENIKAAVEIQGLVGDNAKKAIENGLAIDSYDSALAAKNLEDEKVNAEVQKNLATAYKLMIESGEIQAAVEESGTKDALALMAKFVQPRIDAINEEAGADGEEFARRLASEKLNNPTFAQHYPQYLELASDLLSLYSGREARVNFDDIKSEAFRTGFIGVLLDSLGIIGGKEQSIPVIEMGGVGSAGGGTSESTGALDFGNLE